MKVLLISNMYPGGKSYLGIFIKRQIEALENEGIEIIKVVKNKKLFLAYVSFILKSIFCLLFKSYDLIHAHYGFHSALLPAIVKRKPLIITYHGSDALIEPYRNRFYYYSHKFTMSRADHIIAVSNDVKKKLISGLYAKPDKISVISCGVDTSKFIPLNKIEARNKLGIDENSKVVLFVGKIVFMKGVDVIYDCAHRMQDTLFILIGDGPLRSDIKNCKFPGSRPHKEMPLWMNASDVFVLPSRSEGTPVVLLESLSCGIPVISSDVGGCPDLIKEGKTGYLIAMDNPMPAGQLSEANEISEYFVTNNILTALQDKIVSVLSDPEKMHLMGQQGRQDMIDNYDNRKIAQKVIRLYDKVWNKYPMYSSFSIFVI